VNSAALYAVLRRYASSGSTTDACTQALLPVCAERLTCSTHMMRLLINKRFEGVYPLGFKDYSQDNNALDAIDDGKIALAKYTGLRYVELYGTLA
jgi:hypothetical protein